MEWWSHQWIVIDIEYPFRRLSLLPNKDVSVYHRTDPDVVTQRLHLEPVVAIQWLPIAALVDLIRIDVESTVSVDIAEAKVIASHCRMTTLVERGNVPMAKSSADEGAGRVVVDQDAFESVSREWLPAVKTLADIAGYGGQVVPELYDEPGNLDGAGWCVCWNAVLDELPNVAGAEAVVFGDL